MKLNFKIKNKKGFTLIELLVVIAIIGILATVVLGSLNTAREKGKIAAIKSNLKNMGTQMALSYSDIGNYSASNTGGTTNRPNTVCIGPVVDMVMAIKKSGATTRCLSVNQASWGDFAQRWGATGLIYTTTAPVKAWSINNLGGIVAWDALGVNSTGAFVATDVQMNWDTAVNACALSGGRLPAIEELKTLFDAKCEGAGITDCNNGYSYGGNLPGFVGSKYWSGTTVPSNNNWAYTVEPGDAGWMSFSDKSSINFVHCVR